MLRTPSSRRLQQFGKILDVEIIFNERGSKVSALKQYIYEHVSHKHKFPTDYICPMSSVFLAITALIPAV